MPDSAQNWDQLRTEIFKLSNKVEELKVAGVGVREAKILREVKGTVASRCSESNRKLVIVA